MAVNVGGSSLDGSAWFLDVGQGDCTVLIDPTSRAGLLIDCPSKSVVSVLEFLESESIALHALVVTHWDLDHYGGIARLAANVRPCSIYYNHDTLFTDPSKHRMIRTTLKSFLDRKSSGSALKSYRAGDSIEVDDLSLKFLAPTQAEVTEAYLAGKRNVASAVTMVETAAGRVLIGGDAVAATWTRLIKERTDLRADVFRWPHHGANLHDDQSGVVAESVLQLVKPQAVVISVGGNNRYTHPAKRVIHSSVDVGARVMCTQVTPACLAAGSNNDRQILLNADQKSKASQAGDQCAGTVALHGGKKSLEIRPTGSEHDTRVLGWDTPMCIKL